MKADFLLYIFRLVVFFNVLRVHLDLVTDKQNEKGAAAAAMLQLFCDSTNAAPHLFDDLHVGLKSIRYILRSPCDTAFRLNRGSE